MRRVFALMLLLGLLLALPATASAHVKWFTDFSFDDQPRPLGEVVTPLFVVLALLSAAAIGGLVILERRIDHLPLYQRINRELEARRDESLTVMRVAMGAVLLMSWQADAMLVPELDITQSWIGWLQFLTALLLLFRVTVPLAGVGVIVLYIIGEFEFGIFHMLDYVLYLGAGYYLLVQGFREGWIRESGLPAMYLTLGFSLCWVALEKLIYPQWGLDILRENSELALGFDREFFLTSAAFVEFALGYLLIICLLERPLALAITLVFFTTTLIFGKVEIVGHTLVHGMLIVFLLQGPGPGRFYKPPIELHQRLNWRVAFAVVNFLLLLALLLLPYSMGAQGRYEDEALLPGLPFDI